MHVMSTYCQVTGARPQFGKTVSHSHKRTNRRFDPNLQTKHYWVPSLGRTIKLTLTPRGMKIIDKRGIDVVAAELIAKGEKI